MKTKILGEELNFSKKQIRDDNVQTYIEHIKVFDIIKTLDIQKNWLSDKGLEGILNALQKPSELRRLILSSNTITDLSIDNLSKFVKNSIALIELDLSFNQVSNISPLVESLTFNTTLIKISLSSNRISEDCIEKIANFIKVHKKIEHVFLNNLYYIKEKSAFLISEAIKNHETLVSLNLGENWIENKGAISIANALKFNKRLEVIDLSSNNISNEVVYEFRELIVRNKSIFSINLKNNKILTDGGNTLIEALKNNRLITNFDLTGNGLSSYQLTEISRLTGNNRLQQKYLCTMLYCARWLDRIIKSLPFSRDINLDIFVYILSFSVDENFHSNEHRLNIRKYVIEGNFLKNKSRFFKSIRYIDEEQSEIKESNEKKLII